MLTNECEPRSGSPSVSAHLLFHLLGAAELYTRCAARLLRSHSRGDFFFDELVEVGTDF